MANGIAVVDNWIGVPDPRIATQQRYYSSYPAPVGYYQLYSPAGVVWETETLSSWSEWSCDHDGPCCGCDCDCQPETKDHNLREGCEHNTQKRRSAPGIANPQSHRNIHEPSPFVNVGSKPRTQHNMRRPSDGAALRHDKQDFSSMEDLIYHAAKQQRHLNDAQRRIQDWIKVMPGLAGNSTVSGVEPKAEKCGCKNCKEERRRDARKAGKGKKHRYEAEKKKRRK